MNKIFVQIALSISTFTAFIPDSAAAKKSPKPNYKACSGYDLLAEYGEAEPSIPLIQPGEVGLAACETIVQIPPKRLDHWFNGATLNQRRALHLISLGRDVEALRALDAADEIGSRRSDILYDGSLAISSAVLRAIALAKIGQTSEALNQLEKVRGIRPFYVQAQSLLDDVELSVSGDLNQYVDRLIHRSIFDPNSIRFSLPFFIAAGRHREAIPLIKAVNFQEPAVAEGWTPQSSPLATQETLFKMQAAYIYAAIGDEQNADQLMQQATTNDKNRGQCASNSSNNSKITNSSNCIEEDSINHQSSKYWKNSLELAKSINDKNFIYSDVNKLVEEKEYFDPVSIDINNKILEIFKLKTNRYYFFHKEKFHRNFKEKFDYKSLAMRLLVGDSIDVVPEFEKGKESNFLVGEVNGLTENIEINGVSRTMRLTSDWATESILDDMLIYAIVQKAKSLKKDGVIFLSRDSMKRFTRQKGLSKFTSYLSGREVSARISFVNINDENSKFSDQKWRFAKISDLEREISPRHLEIMKQRSAFKRPLL